MRDYLRGMALVLICVGVGGVLGSAAGRWEAGQVDPPACDCATVASVPERMRALEARVDRAAVDLAGRMDKVTEHLRQLDVFVRGPR